MEGAKGGKVLLDSLRQLAFRSHFRHPFTKREWCCGEGGHEAIHTAEGKIFLCCRGTSSPVDVAETPPDKASKAFAHVLVGIPPVRGILGLFGDCRYCT